MLKFNLVEGGMEITTTHKVKNCEPNEVFTESVDLSINCFDFFKACLEKRMEACENNLREHIKDAKLVNNVLYWAGSYYKENCCFSVEAYIRMEEALESAEKYGTFRDSFTDLLTTYQITKAVAEFHSEVGEPPVTFEVVMGFLLNNILKLQATKG